MDLDILKQHLKQAEEHVAVGQKHIARQAEIIAELEADGHDVTDSRRLLQLFEEVQALHVAGRDRLRRLVEEATALANKRP